MPAVDGARREPCDPICGSPIQCDCSALQSAVGHCASFASFLLLSEMTKTDHQSEPKPCPQTSPLSPNQTTSRTSVLPPPPPPPPPST